MIQLRTLGSCDLSAPDRPEAAAVLTQPKRFALLVYLATATPRGFVRRDTLLALFWPETDQVHGRQVLRQTVYLLRQSLGTDAIASRGDEEIAVNTDALRCDVGLFEEALAAGRTADALESYRGDFLAGLHVPDASQALAEWIEGERRRLRALATGGAWALAKGEEQGGNGAGASHWARRAVALDPDDEHGVKDLMLLLARVGDRAGALRAYAEYTRRAREELDAEPGPELRQLAESLRGAATSAPEPSASAVPAEGSAPTASPALAPMVSVAPRRRQRMLVGAAVALGLVILAAGVIRVTRGSSAPPVIAVGPITDAFAGEGTASNVPADLLSTSLTRLVGLHVIPVTRLYDLEAQLRAAGRPGASVIEAAREAGAGELIQGTLHRAAADRLQLDLQVIHLASGAVERAYRAEGADLFAVVDDATSRIALSFGVPSPPGRITDVTTQSVVAYRLYDQGLRSYYLDDVTGALRLFTAALAEDSSFAMAAYYAGLAASVAHLNDGGPFLIRAARLADRATDRERLLILEGVAELAMSPAANALADTLVVRYPLDPDAQFAVGHSLERRGDFLAAARQYRRVIAMDSLSLARHSARCLACEAYQRLWWSYIYADSAAAAERVARDMDRAQHGNSALWLLGVALARQDKGRAAYQVWASADSARGGSGNLELGAVLLAIRSGDFARADEALRRLMRTGSQPMRADAAWLLVISLRAQGRLVEALGVARNVPLFPATGTVLLESGRALEAAALFERQLHTAVAPEFPGHIARHEAWQLTHVATCLAAVGDTVRLAALADSVEHQGSRSGFGRDPRLHHYIRGLLWKARGNLARAAESFRASVWSWSDGYTRANYELASALLSLHRPREAIYPLEAALRGDLESSNLYITRTELHELLARAFEAAGAPDSAVTQYQMVAAAWSHADPAFRARRERARSVHL
jgi:DNA-binding SARP family transcriptional activator